ncbi:hypothetical protein, partial [Metabacillus fastidiosus]|uniref:hypothetical protein n=1 Tax=Metabacillus fastidiosus TaxID=1458 RepID=UPI003D2D3AB0
MSKSKHYILSFTTLFYNEKGYVLMFNRHQNVAHLDSFPVAFDPWNRYSALIMRDMKVGTKVKRKTDLIKSVGADFRTIWESDDPTTLQQGSLYYLSNVSELLNKGEKDPIYGDSVDKYKKVNPFYNRVDEIIKDVNGMVVKGAEGVDNLPFVDLKQHSDNHANLDQSYSTSLGTLSKSELFNKLLVTNEGSTIDMLETMTLLNEDGYNQAIELANVVFKGGLTTGSMERLLAIQYGEKVLDIAKANYVKSALGMLLDKVSDSHMLSMQGNRTDDETAKVLIGSEGYKSKLDQSTLDRRDGVVDKFEVLVKIPDIHYVQHAEGISTIKNVKQSDFLPQVNLGHVAMLSFLPNSVNGSKRFWLESTVTGLDDSGSNVISHGDISNDIYTTLFKESSIEGMSFSKNIKSSEIMKSPSNITRTYEMITDTDTASADITHIGQSQLEGQDQATVYNLTYASGVSLESVKHVSKECDLSTSNRAVAVTLGNKDKLDLFEIYTWVEGTEEGIEVAGIDHVVYGDLITIDNIKLLNIFSAIYDEISISNLYSKEGVSLDLSLVQYYRSNDANILNTETAQLISDSEGDMTYYNFAENPEGHVLDILVDNSDTAVLLNEHECNILNDRLSLAGINDIVDLAVIEESIVDKVSLIFDTDRDPISLGRKSNMDFDADVEDEVSVYIPEKEYNTDIIQSSLTHIRETEYATEVGLGTRATVHEAIYDLSHDKGISAKVEEDIYETDMQESTNSVKYDKPYDIALTHTDSSRKIEVDYDVDVQLSELFNMVQEELEVSLEGIRNNRKVVSEVETLLESLEAVQINEIAYTVDVTVPDRSFMNSVYDVVVHLVEDADLQDIDIEVKLASWDEAKSEGTYNLVLNASELALDGNVYQDITLHQIDEPTTSTSYDVTLLETMESDGLTKTPDVLLHTLAEVEIESATDTELQTSIKAETTRTTDLVLETMDESSTSSNTDVIVESTQKGSINSASEVVIEWGAESAVDGNMLRDITLDWTNKSTTSTSYDVMLLDIIESEVESNT